MKSHIFTAVSLGLTISHITAFACGPYYFEPGEYHMYRISDQYLGDPVSNEGFNYGSDENCILWQQQTSPDIPISDIYALVYKADISWIESLRYHQSTSRWSCSEERNQFAEWLWEDTEAADFLLLAKQCEETRDRMNDPWYYPSRKDPEKMTLDGIIKTAQKYDGKRFADRYVLQALRAMFSLRQFDDCINYWNDRKHVMKDNIIRRLALRYVAGAYFNIGEAETAMTLFGEADDVSSLLYCAGGSDADSWELMYEYAPETISLRASIERTMIYAEGHVTGEGGGQFLVIEEDVVPLLKSIRNLSLRIAGKGKVSDPDLWYYTAAFAEHLLGHNAEASRLLSKAERSKGSQYMKESIRVFRIYLDALGPYDNAYENKILNGVRWLEGKIREHIDDAREETVKHGMYYTKINFNHYYWNDMLRKIIHAGVVPQLEKAGRGASAIAFSNMADNLIFNIVDQIDADWSGHRRVTLEEYRTDCCFNSLDYSSQTFDLLNRFPVEDLILYVHTLEHPSNETQRYLNSKGYNNIDFFREVIGTRMIRQMKYAEATEWLSQVPTSFQSQLNTYREGYFQYDPFLPEKTAIKDNADYKYNFAREMASLEESISQTSDPGRKALLITRFATGIKNSLGNCWALSFYGLSVADIYTATRPTPFSIAQEAGFARANELYRKALSLCHDKETTSQINYFLGNRKTVMEKYSTTQTAAFIRGRCDTYSDYHFENRDNYWDSRYGDKWSR